MRKFLIALVIMLGIIFVMYRLSEVELILETFRRGESGYIFFAGLLQIFWLVIVGASYQAIYQALGIQQKLRHMVPLVTAVNFTNIIAPTVGLSGMAVFISEARRRNYSPGRVAIAWALFVEFDYLGFLCVLILGLIVLFRRNHLSGVEITASAIFMLIAGLMAVLLYLGMVSADALSKALTCLVRLANRVARPFIHREYLSEQRAHDFAYEAAEGLLELRTDPKKMLIPALLALSNKTIQIINLALIFMAFKVPISIGTIVAGFSIASLFAIVSPTPAGIGIVEGALTLILKSMYIPLESAAIITLAYRGITFWLPLLLGMIAFRWIGKETKDNLLKKS